MARAETLKPFILSWEGGFANIPGDRGGATNKGITIATYRSVFGKERTVEDLKTITDIEWLYIYKSRFWDKWKADDIRDQSIANLLVDWLWNSGKYGIRIPQSVLGVAIDGFVGPKTIAAINSHPDQQELFRLLWEARKAYFERIAKGAQKKFLKGWLNRLGGIKYGCLVCSDGKRIHFIKK